MLGCLVGLVTLRLGVVLAVKLFCNPEIEEEVEAAAVCLSLSVLGGENSNPGLDTFEYGSNEWQSWLTRKSSTACVGSLYALTPECRRSTWQVGDPTGADASGHHCCVQCKASCGNSCWSTYLEKQTDWRLPAYSSHKAIPLLRISTQR